ncbi:MAG: UPF0175 family protein [Proteobacteria bacterium]|nr:UPF0175 family protein [Pseudomonadota bacterium]
MQTLEIQLPDFLQVDPKEIKFILAAKLYEQGKLSIGQSAELAGVSKRTFIELLGNYDVSIFNYDEKEIKRDYENA